MPICSCKPLRLAATCLVLGWYAQATNAAAQPVAELVGVTGSTPRSPVEPIQLSWSEQDVAPLWSRLAFELDGMDVTAMVNRHAGGASLAIPVPLARGDHQLRVLLGQADGNLTEWANWTFSVAGLPRTEGDAELVMRINQRLNSSGSLNPVLPDATQADAAARLSLTRETDDWSTSASSQLWFNSVADSNTGGSSAELGEYLITADNGTTSFKLGNHQMPMESLIHSSFLRRGASVTTALPGDARLNGFVMRSEPVVGTYPLTGVQAPNHRVGGMTYEKVLSQNADSSFGVSAGLVGGEGDDVQGSSLLPSSLHQGSSGSVGANASWFGRRLRLKGELAASQYNWNSNGLLPVADSTDNDRAHLVALQYQTESKAPGSSQWVTDVEHKEVGTFYRSLAYLGLPADRRSDRIRTNWRSGAWQAGAGLSRQETNVGFIQSLPRIALDQGDVMLLWSPTFSEQRPWYGHPTVSGTMNQQNQRQTYTPAAYLGTTVDNNSWQRNLNLSLAHESWSGQVGLGTGGFDNVTLPQFSTRSNTATLSGQWQFGERLTLSPVLQLSRLTYVTSGASDLVQTGSLFADFAIIPEVLMGNLNIGLNRFNRAVDSQREMNKFLTAEFIWRLQRATEKRPGWDMRLAVTRQDVENDLYPSLEGYFQQVFLGLTMTWPVRIRP
jgi:hypothetical protein